MPKSLSCIQEQFKRIRICWHTQHADYIKKQHWHLHIHSFLCVWRLYYTLHHQHCKVGRACRIQCAHNTSLKCALIVPQIWIVSQCICLSIIDLLVTSIEACRRRHQKHFSHLVGKWLAILPRRQPILRQTIVQAHIVPYRARSYHILLCSWEAW